MSSKRLCAWCVAIVLGLLGGIPQPAMAANIDPQIRPPLAPNPIGNLVRVHGRVIDPAGKAVAGAAIVVVGGAWDGETLIAQATGLGPTLPGVDPGQPFPATGLQEVNSPVDVTVNGRASTVLNKVGWPGAVDVFRVDFRMPDGIASGMATIQLSAAWIPGAGAQIAVK